MSRDTAGTYRSRTIRSANRSSVQWSRPSGGAEQASITSFASASPSSLRLSGRGGWGRRRSAASSPPAQKSLRTRATVLGLTRTEAAACSSVWPSSASSSTRACASSRAAARPEEIACRSRLRCSSESFTSYFVIGAS